MQDLENALYYSLAREVVRIKTVAGENLDALKSYVIVLTKVNMHIGTHSSFCFGNIRITQMYRH